MTHTIRLLISGYCGHMGQVLAKLCAMDERFVLVAGLDPMISAPQNQNSTLHTTMPIPVFSSAKDVYIEYDALIDFSHPALLSEIETLGYAHHKPTVIATTGYTAQELERRDKLATTLPLFTSANMSLGINLLLKLAQETAKKLYPDFDIEILEAHHRRKLDSPSGTALFLADGISSSLDDKLELVTDRSTRRTARPSNEIGITSLRGGSIVGEHEIIFAGNDEVITLKHHAGSRAIFANGALNAALFLQGKANGHYSMSDLLT